MEGVLQDQVLRLHWAAGGVALVVAPLAMVMRKGGRWHRRWGWVFIAALVLMCGTAVAISLPDRGPVMMLVALFSAHLALVGWRSLYLKDLHKGRRPDWIDWALHGTAAVFNAGLLLWGVAGLLLKHAHNPMYPVFVGFGIIGCAIVVHVAGKFVRNRHDRHQWLYDHVTAMVAGYIATVSAFSAVNLTPMVPSALAGAVWIWPSAVGAPAIHYTIRYFRRRYGRSRTPHDDFKVKLG
jgi:hypothetical protein